MLASLTLEQRLFVVRMIHGGQVDAHDFHLAGFDEGLLAALLVGAGFCDVRRVAAFGLFDDTSALEYLGVPISLNLAATACGKPGPRLGKISIDPAAAS